MIIYRHAVSNAIDANPSMLNAKIKSLINTIKQKQNERVRKMEKITNFIVTYKNNFNIIGIYQKQIKTIIDEIPKKIAIMRKIKIYENETEDECIGIYGNSIAAYYESGTDEPSKLLIMVSMLAFGSLKKYNIPLKDLERKNVIYLDVIPINITKISWLTKTAVNYLEIPNFDGNNINSVKMVIKNNRNKGT